MLHSVTEAFALTKLPVCPVLIQRVPRSDDAVNCDCICAAVNMLPVMSALAPRPPLARGAAFAGGEQQKSSSYIKPLHY